MSLTNQITDIAVDTQKPISEISSDKSTMENRNNLDKLYISLAVA